jgi:LEA14-like dessication related protein
MKRRGPILLALLGVLCLGACSVLPTRDPPQVTVAGLQPLQGEGLEMRMLVKLRVQNPNDVQIDYNGVSLQLEVQDKTFATGVSDRAGSVPRFGETVIEVPVTISAMNIVRQLMGAMDGRAFTKVDYVLNGKLSGSLFSSVRFKSAGTLDMPRAPATADTSGT